MAYESDPIAEKLNDLVGSQQLYFDLISFGGLSTARQALIGTWELVNEVYNGGFSQYFRNSSREHAVPMIAVLRSINADRAAAILAQAIALIGTGTRWGDTHDFAAAEAIPEQLRNSVQELEDAFYNELDNLHRLVFDYLSKHRDEIDAPPEFWTEQINP